MCESPSIDFDGELIHLEPLDRVGGPIVLLDCRWLPVQGAMYPFQVKGKGFDSFIAPSFRGALSVRLVVEGATEIIVPLITSFLFGAVSFLPPVLNPVTGISIVNDVMQVTVSPLATFLWWSQTTG
jgi:hypothetical protein